MNDKHYSNDFSAEDIHYILPHILIETYLEYIKNSEFKKQFDSIVANEENDYLAKVLYIQCVTHEALENIINKYRESVIENESDY